ncbi:hypothetical protein H4R26_005389 [Coemansia thaxteri]|uniref:mannan endo-1,4-beta-mannosidase n=1 Tax=Coemansia thaxteri TaxID=2663907 RepID=A0A9W8BFQ2_9FUNG|nr:hypothetical protein H4R26_005389 [Coemansia thaxteri]
MYAGAWLLVTALCATLPLALGVGSRYRPVDSQYAMAAPHNAEFVSAKGTRLWRNGKPYYVSGANYWQAMNLGMAHGPSGDRQRVLRDLEGLALRGVNMVRILAASEGSQLGRQPDRLYPALVPLGPGEYDESVFVGLDWFLAQLPRFNMTATVSLSNYWTWSGGAAQYVSWATGTPIPYPVQWDHLNQVFAGGDYQRFLDYASRFYADSALYNTTQRWYKEHIRAVVTRENSVTGTRYCDDSSVLAWELMNEPQIIESVGADGHAQLFRWINDTASYIASLDPRHLITTGAESKNGRTWFSTMHKSPHITLASCHFWPLNWGYYNSTDPSNQSTEYSISKLHDFVQNINQWSLDLNMPSILFEYGLMRDSWGQSSGLNAYLPSAPVTHRDKFFAAVADSVREHSSCCGQSDSARQAFAGAAFWAYAGIARPPVAPTEQIAWTGDPPHEPPGWNSVYDSDNSTLSIIANLFSQRQVADI